MSVEFTGPDKEGIHKEEVKSIFLYEIQYADDVTHSHPDEPEEHTHTYWLYWADWDVDVTWKDQVYTHKVIKHSEITHSSDGRINDVQVSIGNVDRMIQYFIELYDLVGRKVRVIEIFEGIEAYLSYTFTINKITAKKDVAAFTLGMGFDFLIEELPNRRMFSRRCGWIFKGSDGNCNYQGADTTCSKSFLECKRKGNLANFGGFPGILNERIYI